MRALIIGGCEVNTTDKDGRSAVYWAAQEGHMDVLRVSLCLTIPHTITHSINYTYMHAKMVMVFSIVYKIGKT